MIKNEIPVTIEIETFHQQANETEEYAEKVNGKCIQMENVFYLRYTEKQTEDALVTFKVVPNKEVQLTRKMEGHKLHLTFDLQKKVVTQYHTPYGNIPIEIETNLLEIQFDQEKQAGKLAINYQLYNGHDLLGDYKIRLQFNS